MHEMSITQGIIEVCEQYADGRRVIVLEVEIGDLSGVVPEALEFCFEACSLGTLLEGARLNVIRMPGKGRCMDCDAEVPLKSMLEACQGCGGFRVSILSGDQMRVREIEVED